MPSTLSDIFSKSRVYAFADGYRPEWDDMNHKGKYMLTFRIADKGMTPLQHIQRVEATYKRMLAELRTPRAWGEYAVGISSSKTGAIQVWLGEVDVAVAKTAFHEWICDTLDLDQHRVVIEHKKHDHRPHDLMDKALPKLREAYARIRNLREKCAAMGMQLDSSDWRTVDHAMKLLVNVYRRYAHSKGVRFDEYTGVMSTNAQIIDDVWNNYVNKNELREAFVVTYDAMRGASNAGLIWNNGTREGFEESMSRLLYSVSEWAYLKSAEQNRLQHNDPTVLDVHHHDANGCRHAVNKFLAEMSAKKKTNMRIITGWGKHSPNNVPVLKPRVQEMLARWDGYVVTEPFRNTGVLVINVKKKTRW